MKRIKSYENSLGYKNVVACIDEGDFATAFQLLGPSVNKKKTHVISLIEVLKQAFDEGNTSDEFKETLRGATRMYYQEMCDEGLIHQTKMSNITGISREK